MVDFIKLDDEKPRRKIRRIRISFKAIFLTMLVLFLISSLIGSISYSISSKIAVIPINGPILTEKSTTLYGQSISSRDVATTIRAQADDNSVKAILIDINSPGGSPVASEEISKAIEYAKIQKPVYSLISDVGASGAFWIAVSTNKIYASSMSTVGSIGVTSAGLSFENFIVEHNITYRKQTAGEFKDMGSIFRKPSKIEQEKIQTILDDIHTTFINHVATSRNLTYKQVEKYATGEIFLGTKAKKIGFIDEIGYYPDVIAELKNVTGAKNALVITLGNEPNLMDAIGLKAMLDFSPKSMILLQ